MGISQRKFAGHEFDADTGLSFMEARYYNGLIGRFISQDPAYLEGRTDLANPQSANSYSYGLNNPLRYNDPDGQIPVDTVVDAGFTAWDGSKFIKYGSQWAGDQLSIGLGKLIGSERFENNGRIGATESVANLKQSSVDLSISAGSLAVPYASVGTIKLVGKADEAVKVTKQASEWARTSFNATKQQADKLKGVTNRKVENLVKKTYQTSDSIIGGTPAAAKYTYETGNLVRGSSYTKKLGYNEKWIKYPKEESIEWSRTTPS
jgi:RHS repeat-associated protein